MGASCQGMAPQGGGVYSYSMPANAGGAWTRKGLGKGTGDRLNVTACSQDVASCDASDARCFEPCTEEKEMQGMSFVGDGHGDYIQETNYRFVGKGAGQYVGEGKRKILNLGSCTLACGGLCCAALAMVLIMQLPLPGGSDQPGDSSDSKLDPLNDDATTYNCQQGYASWQAEWPAGKKSWCCIHQGMACEIVGGTAAKLASATRGQASGSHLPASSPQEAAQSPPTHVLSFNCTAALEQFEHEWSTMKKDWCCKYARLGCPKAASSGLPQAFQTHVLGELSASAS